MCVLVLPKLVDADRAFAAGCLSAAPRVGATTIGACLREIFPLPSDDGSFDALLAALDQIPGARS